MYTYLFFFMFYNFFSSLMVYGCPFTLMNKVTEKNDGVCVCMIIPSVSVQFIVGHGKRSISFKKHFPLLWLLRSLFLITGVLARSWKLGPHSLDTSASCQKYLASQPVPKLPTIWDQILLPLCDIHFLCILYLSNGTLIIFICDPEINMRSAFTFIDR